jgi:protein TonB
MNRTLPVIATVVLFHIAAIWALQSGLLRRAVEVLVPAEILIEIMSPPNEVRKVPPALASKAPSAPQLIAKPTPVPVAPVQLAPPPPAASQTPNAPVPSTPTPTSATASAGTTSAINTAPVGAASSNTPAPTRVELPSSDADYLHNPKPPYPSVSKRLGEQGRVVVRTLIGADGVAQQAEIRQSSGFDRLDQSALNTALRWRYVPGKRAGVPEAMWFNVPFTFVLE